MYCYLGIVAQDDLIAGRIVPSFVLCKSQGNSEARSGWRVVRQDDTNKNQRNMKKVLVTELYGHDDMIDFQCSYRTRDHMHGDSKYAHEDTKKYYPKGALFWFECSIYGEPNGSAVFICRIPVLKKVSDTERLKRLLKSKSEVPSLRIRLAREPTMIYDSIPCIKPRIEPRRR